MILVKLGGMKMDQNDYAELQMYRQQEMKKRKSKEKRRAFFKNIIKNGFSRKIILIIILIALISGFFKIGLDVYLSSQSQVTTLGFEDIGELATESCSAENVNVTDKSRKLFGVTIPFTQSKYIYSYQTIIKAGLDFSKIEWSEKNNQIHVKLPEIKVLSCEIDVDSFKVYYESESIFTPITLKENNDNLKMMKDEAVKSAIDNGLYERAKANAKQLLKSHFAQKYDLDHEYTIHFE